MASLTPEEIWAQSQEEAVVTAELKLDTEQLFEAIDRKRRRLRLNRKQVAKELGVSPGAVSFWGSGGGIGADAALRACVWLSCDIREFARQHEAA